MISLENKVSIITGGSRGIGAATALLLAEAGSDVVINYVKSEKEAYAIADGVAKLGRRAAVYQGNVACRKTAKELMDKAVNQFGRLDVVVNNAGIWTHGEIGTMPDEVWDETIRVNLDGVFHICNAAIPHLKQTGGRIINIASTAGQRGEAFHSHYAASKGGVLAFSKSLAMELAPHRILVNSVAPGWVDTDMNSEVFSDREFKQKAIDGIPLKKLATAKDVANAVLFLASDLANHITGSTININGGSVLA
jgi:3-oxoacyl-[acyl-carrier protein] reductase